MPNRILRPWQDSFNVDKLSERAEVFFVRLIMTVDDFGRFHAHSGILRSNLYPLRVDSVKNQHVESALKECADAGLLTVYCMSGQTYLQINNFRQRTRQEGSKFPSPEDARRSNDGQMTVSGKSNAGLDGDGDGDDSMCGADEEPSDSTPKEPPVMEFPCLGTPDVWGLSQAKINEWSEAFPGVDVMAECRKALQWLRDRPERRKTSRGMTRFLGAWMERSQNQGRGKQPAPPQEQVKYVN